VWQRLATDLRPELDRLAAEEIGLADVPDALARILEGKMRGRTLVAL
jgi:acrylyl-CoA reductase (NADPH)